MITTREAIKYQFSLIFGYSSPKDFVLGDVIGPGKLTKKKVKELSFEVVKFLRMYNAILRDYTGAELFSIELGLYNTNEKDDQTKIYPKSMLFVPGYYKDSESLLLALKPETGYLDAHKTRESLIDICKLFYEVEEFVERPELNKQEQEQVMNKFAFRFSKKLYGELLEDKWNKKLIGLNTTLPTEKEMLNTYTSLKSDIEILMNRIPCEINLLNLNFEKEKVNLEEKEKIDHLKYKISEPSARFIIDNTLKLGTNLFNIANTGTIDETQDSIISYIINNLIENAKAKNESKISEELNLVSEKNLSELERFFSKFLDHSKMFLISGETGSISELIITYKNYIKEKGQIENESFDRLCEITSNMIEDSITSKKTVRANEFESVINYFSEISKSSFKLLKEKFPHYLCYKHLKKLINDFIQGLIDKFNTEQKAAKVLGIELINKFKKQLFNNLELNPNISLISKNFSEETIIIEFSNLLTNSLELFENAELNIGDIVLFAEAMMDGENALLKVHIDKFTKFSKEINYLLSYILRYSTINRFLKEEPIEEISDPVSFAGKFHRFLEKRIGGVDLAWKTHVLGWIQDYTKKYIVETEKKKWSLDEIYEDFVSYLENREGTENNTKNFFEFLDGYISKISKEGEKKLLLEFFKQYEFCLSIKNEFPKYVKSKIIDEIQAFSKKKEKIKTIDLLNTDNEDNFYTFLKEKELKYFSRLIPRPITLILKHNLTKEEKEAFKEDLFHVFNFRYWHNSVKVEISDNFKSAYKSWVKEI